MRLIALEGTAARGCPIKQSDVATLLSACMACQCLIISERGRRGAGNHFRKGTPGCQCLIISERGRRGALRSRIVPGSFHTVPGSFHTGSSSDILTSFLQLLRQSFAHTSRQSFFCDSHFFVRRPCPRRQSFFLFAGHVHGLHGSPSRADRHSSKHGRPSARHRPRPRRCFGNYL